MGSNPTKFKKCHFQGWDSNPRPKSPRIGPQIPFILHFVTNINFGFCLFPGKTAQPQLHKLLRKPIIGVGEPCWRVFLKLVVVVLLGLLSCSLALDDA